MTSPASTQHDASSNGRPPPLPPRASYVEAPPSYSEHPLMGLSSQDPRSSSTQSLVPDPNIDSTGQRRLLLVYIHGFMGNETSFRSFPAHVHNLVTITLGESHVVHTKLYPRYRSKYSLEVARDQFLAWLDPHEDQWTDVILLGHSMGGLLAADIALVFRHRIIGIINFDVPFLGMHPGIVKAGIGSIFNPSPAPQDAVVPDDQPERKPSRMETLFAPKPNDPNYNPSFENDVRLPVRNGWVNTLHWLNKHYSDGLRQATKGLVKSHFEFGSAMADYGELQDRYAKVRALEEDDERKRKAANPTIASPPRIRFVNYYTVSTGRPKKPKSPKPSRSASPSSSHAGREMQSQGSDIATLASASQTSLTHVHPEPVTPSPRISVEEHRGDDVVPVSPQEPLSATSPVDSVAAREPKRTKTDPPSLPEIPPIPQEPAFVDLMQYPDKAQRKAAEKEHDQAIKEYHKAVKTRNKAINERTKIEEKWEKQQQEKSTQDSQSKHNETKHTTPQHHDTAPLEEDIGATTLGDDPPHPPTPYTFSAATILSQAPPDDRSSIADSSHTLSTVNSNQTNPGPAKPKKLKKFCMLPPKDSSGNKDPTWVKVYMEGMDEVTAHTSLFFVNETYERLVGDVGARIEEWVREADSVRVVREMEGWD